MATTTVLNPPPPSAMFATPDFYPSSPSPFSSHYTSPHLQQSSKTAPSPVQPSSSTKQHAPLSRSSLLFGKSVSDHDSHQATRPPPTNQAKLHKKATHKRSRSGQGDQQGAAAAAPTPPSHTSFTFPTSEDPLSSSYTAPPQPITSSSSRSIKLKQNLRKLTTQPKDNDDPNTIDLSKTARENEERSGIAIQSTSQTTSPASPLTGEVRLPHTGGARHGRSFSATSAQSASTTAFTPTLPFIHPMRQQGSRPHSSSISQTFQPGSIMGNDYSLTEDLHGLGIDTAPSNQSVIDTPPTARSSGSYGTRTSQGLDAKGLSSMQAHANASQVSTVAASTRGPSNPSQSQANISHCSSYTSYTAQPAAMTASNTALTSTTGIAASTTSQTNPTKRHSRSNTLANPPITTTSNPLQDTHKRNSSTPDTGIMTRASTFPTSTSSTNLALTPTPTAPADISAINAARRAFTEKQAAKSQKYEKAARKAEEKDRRRHERRRSSLVGSPKSTGAAGERESRNRAGSLSATDGFHSIANPKDAGEGAASRPRRKSKSNANTTTSNPRSDRTLLSQSYTDLLLQDPSSSSTAAGATSAAAAAGTGTAIERSATPQISRKRKAKSGYLGFWTWVRVRLLWVSKR